MGKLHNIKNPAYAYNVKEEDSPCDKKESHLLDANNSPHANENIHSYGAGIEKTGGMQPEPQDQNEEEAETDDNVQPEPPSPKALSYHDHGYAWVVLGASLYLCSLFTANISSYGVLLPEYIEAFQVTKTQATLIMSLSSGSGVVSGVLAGTLIRIFGYRRVAIVGSFVSAAGILLSGLTDNCHVLYLTHGVMPGFSLIFCTTASVTAVGTYFLKRKAFAFSLLTIGFSLGFIAWAPLIRTLVTHYGRKGGLMVYSGLYFNGLVAGMLLRPVCQRKRKEAETTVKPESNMKIPRKEGGTDNFEYTEKGKPKNWKCFYSCKTLLKGYAFLKNRKVLVYVASFNTLVVGHVVPYVFIAARCEMIGISKDKAALLLSVLGFGGLISRPLLGLLGDKISNHRPLIYGLSGIIAATLNMASYPLTTYVPLLVFCCLYGVTTAGYIGLNTTVLSDLVPLQQLPLAAGLMTTVSGTTQAIANVGAGSLVDATGTFATPFLVFGAVQAVGGLFGLLLYLLIRLDRTKKAADKFEKNKESTKEDGVVVFTSTSGSVWSLATNK